MFIQIVALKNVSKEDHRTITGFRTVVEETLLCSFVESACPDVGEQIEVDGLNYIVRKRVFKLHKAKLSIKVCCHLLGGAP